MTDNVGQTLGRFTERFGPMVVGLVCIAASYWYQGKFFVASAEGDWHVDALYGSIFNIAAAASAFLFAFYTYVRTADGEVLREIRASKVFRRAAGFIIRAVFSTAILAIATVPFMIIVPQPLTAADGWYWVVCFWVGFSFYVLAAVVRSAYHFVAIMEAAYGDRLGA